MGTLTGNGKSYGTWEPSFYHPFAPMRQFVYYENRDLDRKLIERKNIVRCFSCYCGQRWKIFSRESFVKYVAYGTVLFSMF